jgi:pyridoxine 5-phosphate synthase
VIYLIQILDGIKYQVLSRQMVGTLRFAHPTEIGANHMTKRELYLGVNIDHVATVRQARGTTYPDPLLAALLAEQAGADGITAHLREDRRHILDRDIELLQERLQTRLNLEIAIAPDMIAIAEAIRAPHVCLVPERRQELTTEGGLDVVGQLAQVTHIVDKLQNVGSEVSLFIGTDPAQIKAAKKSGAPVIELHTGEYADAKHPQEQQAQLQRLIDATQLAADLGLIVNAGHGLHYHNVTPIAQIPEINELNIGHAIIARAVMTGMEAAVREMKRLMVEARASNGGSSK